MVEDRISTIPMSNAPGRFAIIDPEDYELVAAYGKWYVNDAGYAVKKTRIKGKNVSIRMHVLVNNTPHKWHTDHINGDRLDNRRKNLRTVTATLNAWNIHVDRAHTEYPDLPAGVSYDKSRERYVATFKERKRFDSLEEAINFTKGVHHGRQ